MAGDCFFSYKNRGIKSRDPIEIKCGTIDYVGETIPRAKSRENLFRASFSAKK